MARFALVFEMSRWGKDHLGDLGKEGARARRAFLESYGAVLSSWQSYIVSRSLELLRCCHTHWRELLACARGRRQCFGECFCSCGSWCRRTQQPAIKRYIEDTTNIQWIIMRMSSQRSLLWYNKYTMNNYENVLHRSVHSEQCSTIGYLIQGTQQFIQQSATGFKVHNNSFNNRRLDSRYTRVYHV